MRTRLIHLLLALSVFFPAAPLLAAGTEVGLQLPSGNEVVSRRYPAEGELLAVFLTGEYGWSPYEYQAGAYLAGQGIETWVADFIGAYFLPPGMGSVRKVPDADLVAWLERVHRQSGKREIVLIAPGHMAQAALRLAELWQAGAGRNAPLRGAVLLYPLLYEAVEPGQEPAYDPVVARTRLGIAYLQPEAAAGYWWRERLKAALEAAGSRVELTVLPGLRDGYYRRPDAVPEELEAGARLGELLHDQVNTLWKGSR